MEEVSQEKIERFLSVTRNNGSGSGWGDGDGSGWGWGSGWGDGSGSGWGDGSGSGWGDGDGSGRGEGSGSGWGWGSGWGDGDGSGRGEGSGIGSVNGQKLHCIDGVLTLINKVHGDAAKGAIFNRDFSFTPCYVAKHNGFFAHGETLHAAVEAAIAKYTENMPEEDRVKAFVSAHKKDGLYPNQDYFDWHHRLTGSCEMGRRQFARDHGVDMDGSMTPMEFIALTENSFGGSTIKKLRPYYE